MGLNASNGNGLMIGFILQRVSIGVSWNQYQSNLLWPIKKDGDNPVNQSNSK